MKRPPISQGQGTPFFTKRITSAANAGVVTMATVLSGKVVVKSVILRANDAITADFLNAAVLGGAGSVITFISALEGIRANLAAEDQQVGWDGVVSLPVGSTITITLTGTGATPVDFDLDIEYASCSSSDNGILS